MPGETSKDVSFRLEPNGVISGHVYDEDGKPAEHVLVQTWSYGCASLDGYDWFSSLMMGPADQTDAGGRFVIRDLRPGSYIIRIEHFAGPASYAPDFYPRVARVSDASRIAVRAGGEVAGVDFFLKHVQTFHIRGRVVNAVNKASPSSIQLDLFTSEPFGDLYPSLRVNLSQGQLGVPPGSYFLRARLKDGDELSGEVRRPVTVVNDDVNGVRLVLTPWTNDRGLRGSQGLHSPFFAAHYSGGALHCAHRLDTQRGRNED